MAVALGAIAKRLGALLLLMCMVWAVGTTSGCGDVDRASSVPFEPPLLKERDPTHVLATLDGPYPLPFTHSGNLYAGQFVGVSFDVAEGVELHAETLVPGVELALALYGPRAENGVWGEAIGAHGPERSQLRVEFPALLPGRYLALLTSTGSDGSYHLTGSCLGECGTNTATDCPAVECGFFCPSGFLLDPEGCETCACIGECATELDCPEGMVCSDDRQCIPECQCTTNYEPVCGGDGQTYASACEARCAGVDVVDTQACATQCPDTVCALECAAGFAVGSDGCPVCTCRTACEACDDLWAPVCSGNGQTFVNTCQATCQGEQVAYLGSCHVGCPSLLCGLDCPNGLLPGADGCPTCVCADKPACERTGRVCGANGVTYTNACAAQAAGTTIVYEDTCPSTTCSPSGGCPEGASCVIPADETSCLNNAVDGSCVGVCIRDQSCDALTSATTCPAGYACVDGRCSSECVCSMLYDPVCGADGMTYDNACAAACEGVEVSKPGPCCDGVLACELVCENGYALNTAGCETCRCREAPCACSDTNSPVCAVTPAGTELTYVNACWARCDGYDVLTSGSCQGAP